MKQIDKDIEYFKKLKTSFIIEFAKVSEGVHDKERVETLTLGTEIDITQSEEEVILFELQQITKLILKIDEIIEILEKKRQEELTHKLTKLTRDELERLVKNAVMFLN